MSQSIFRCPTLVQPAVGGVHVGQVLTGGGGVRQVVRHGHVLGVVVDRLPVRDDSKAGLTVPQLLAEVAVLPSGTAAMRIAKRQAQEERSAGRDQNITM